MPAFVLRLSRLECIVWAIWGDQGRCYVLRLRRGAVLRVTALGSVCVTCYGFRWELCNTVLRVTAFWSVTLDGVDASSANPILAAIALGL